jgi:hypothetical protein
MALAPSTRTSGIRLILFVLLAVFIAAAGVVLGYAGAMTAFTSPRPPRFSPLWFLLPFVLAWITSLISPRILMYAVAVLLLFPALLALYATLVVPFLGSPGAVVLGAPTAFIIALWYYYFWRWRLAHGSNAI